jgi:hypothetical protein
MTNIWAVEMEQLSPYGPLGGNMEGTLLSLDCEIKTKFCFIKRPCLLGKLRDM